MMGICEVCGKPAAVEVQDVRETLPTKDRRGNTYRNWARDGKPHPFCSAHARKAVETPLKRGQRYWSIVRGKLTRSIH